MYEKYSKLIPRLKNNSKIKLIPRFSCQDFYCHDSNGPLGGQSVLKQLMKNHRYKNHISLYVLSDSTSNKMQNCEKINAKN